MIQNLDSLVSETHQIIFRTQEIRPLVFTLRDLKREFSHFKKKNHGRYLRKDMLLTKTKGLFLNLALANWKVSVLRKKISLKEAKFYVENIHCSLQLVKQD